MACNASSTVTGPAEAFFSVSENAGLLLNRASSETVLASPAKIFDLRQAFGRNAPQGAESITIMMVSTWINVGMGTHQSKIFTLRTSPSTDALINSIASFRLRVSPIFL